MEGLESFEMFPVELARHSLLQFFDFLSSLVRCELLLRVVTMSYDSPGQTKYLAHVP